MLGGPNFEFEDMVGAAPHVGSVGPALGSPAARGTQPAKPATDDGDFGEEAPTEIFGEIGGDPAATGKLPVTPAAGRPAAPAQAPQARPSKPPPVGPSSPPAQAPAVAYAGADAPQGRPIPTAAPGAATMSADAEVVPANQRAARDAYAENFPHLAQPSPQQGYPAQGPNAHQAAGGYGQAQGASGPLAMPTGTPPTAMKSQPKPLNASSLPGGGQARTIIGVKAPLGVPNHGGGTYPPPSSGPQPAPYGDYSSQPNMQQHGYAQHGAPYGAGQPGYRPSASAVDPQHQPAVQARKSGSIGRDIAIGVAIAALVLGGFLAVKFLILDAGVSKPAETASTSSIATIRLKLPAGVSAELYVDDKKIATVSDKQEIPVTAGRRKVKLVGPNNARCDEERELPAGKTTLLECAMDVGAGAAGSGSGTMAKPVEGSGSGSATSAGAGSGSAASTQVIAQGSGATKPTDKVDKTPTPAVTTTPKPVDKTPTPAVTTTPKPVDNTPKPIDKTPKPVDKTPKPVDKVKPDQGATPAAADGKGYLQVYSKPAAKISIDGVDSGLSTPIAGRALQLTPGKHKVTFTIGGDKFTFAVMIKAGATETLSKDLQ